ncbi:MAG TPA: hypothetical protein VFZ16_15355 [Hyphomicrobiaceae bacterium]|nr:hypothetical protein [Hyphomicrobiaceae bacterium]
MSHPDDVARLREIKRLLDRIQRLPQIAGIPEGGPAVRGSHRRAATAYELCSSEAPPGPAGRAVVKGLQARLGNGVHDAFMSHARPANGSSGLSPNGSASGFANGSPDGYHGDGACELGPPHPDVALKDADDLAPEPLRTRLGPPPLITSVPPVPPPLPPLEVPRRDADRTEQFEDRGEEALDDDFEDRLPSHLDGPFDEPPDDRYDSGPLRIQRETSHALVPVQPSVSVGISPWVFITATAINTMVAAVLAIVITLGVTHREPAPAEPEKTAAIIARPAAEAQPTPEPRPVELLPVGSASEPLRLEALKPARLPLQVRPEEAAQESYILLLSGLPANAMLSGASRMGTDSWLLSPGALERLELIVPEWSASVMEVGVELRRTNGAVVAQSKLWLAVPPPPAPESAKLSDAAIADLVRSGDRLLGRGDVAAARAIYERAAAAGSAQAALAMGSTYDPRRLWSLGVFGMVGNKERAKHWYQRAQELGHPEARARIAALRER